MSTLNVESISHPTSGSNVTINGVTPASNNSLGLRNKIINGNMRIDQRNLGGSLSLSNTSGFGIDRYRCMLQGSATGTLTFQRDTVAPAGFDNSIKATVTTADTSDAQAYIGQDIEGYNITDLAFGTADAKTITLSFWVRASITGTYCGGITGGGSGGNQVGYVFEYSISSANTWEYKTVTITGESSGTYTFDSTTGAGLRVIFDLGSKSASRTASPNTWTAGLKYSSTTSGVVRWKENVNATFYLTGVQLEAGEIATPFEHRSYGDEMARCQRYYYRAETSNKNIHGTFYGGSTYMCQVWFPVYMRATPAITLSGGNASDATLSEQGRYGFVWYKNTASSYVQDIRADAEI